MIKIVHMNSLLQALTGLVFITLILTGCSDSDTGKKLSGVTRYPEQTVIPNGRWMLVSGTMDGKPFPLTSSRL